MGNYVTASQVITVEFLGSFWTGLVQARTSQMERKSTCLMSVNVCHLWLASYSPDSMSLCLSTKLHIFLLWSEVEVVKYFNVISRVFTYLVYLLCFFSHAFKNCLLGVLGCFQCNIRLQTNLTHYNSFKTRDKDSCMFKFTPIDNSFFTKNNNMETIGGVTLTNH